MIAIVRRPAPMPVIRTRPCEPEKSSERSAARPDGLQPAGQRTGRGASSVLPYLSLPR